MLTATKNLTIDDVNDILRDLDEQAGEIQREAKEKLADIRRRADEYHALYQKLYRAEFGDGTPVELQ